MDIAGSVALVTGANRGLGRSLAAELVRRGARVYAGARNQGSIDLPGVTPVTLDITDPCSVSSALEAADDITILVNNAGISTGTSILNGDLDAVRREMETHFFGTLSVTRAAAPVIAPTAAAPSSTSSRPCRGWRRPDPARTARRSRRSGR